MHKIVSFLRDHHAEIYKGSLFLLAIAIIVSVLPKQGKFRYEFQNLKGKPWYHNSLIAPFDFSIKKSPEELATERSEIIRNAKPYFRFDSSIYTRKLQEFALLFEKNWPQSRYYNEAENRPLTVKRTDTLTVKNPARWTIKQRQYFIAQSILDSLYNAGIIQLNEVIEDKSGDYTVFLVKNNIAEERELRSFFTVQAADQYLRSSLAKEKNVDRVFLISILENLITHNVFYDQEFSDKVLQQAIDEISLTRGKIVKDQNIISKGEILDEDKYRALESLKAEYEEQIGNNSSYLLILLGQVIIVSLSLMILIFFLALFRREIFLDNTKVMFMLFIITLMVLMASLSLKFEFINIYLLPFCILPIIIRAFYDTRFALFAHLATVLVIAFIAPNRFEFVFVQLIAGIVSIFSIVDMRKRSQVFIASGIIFFAYCMSYFGLTIVQDGSIDAINLTDISSFGVSATLTLFSYPLIFIFEKVFGFTSDVSLMELSDTNSPLLRELASKAPGTFHHSLQVANLAEDVIYRIGGNALLVRTGALYHDIGKMDMPVYYIENQISGINPHEELSFEESASIIIDHVIKGIEMAKKHNLPEQIIDFIRTHHGTTRTNYFYHSYLNYHPNEDVDESMFRYPGPIPFSKETAVLMMADSVEAASRSLKTYDITSIDNLVEKIIDGQIQQNQFVNADLTFKDITLIKKTLKKKLMSMYHIRVEYPR